MLLLSIWITGLTRSGKTTRLVKAFSDWVHALGIFKGFPRPYQLSQPLTSAALIFAANDDNRQDLADKLSISVQGSYPVVCKTPLGFISDEVMLFWPLLFEQLHLKAQFPVRLRPETEQELATQLWRSQLQQSDLKQAQKHEYRLIRRILDLLQLAGASGIPAEDIPNILEQGLPDGRGGFEQVILSVPSTSLKNPPVQGFEQAILSVPINKSQKPETTVISSQGETSNDQSWSWIGELLIEWREWCLERGLLSYGVIYELYWRYLLPNTTYQAHLIRRYQAVFADDVDDYPAVCRNLFNFLLDHERYAVFTYNPNGQVRLGLNADPNYLTGLASRCQGELLSHRRGLDVALEESVLQSVTNPLFITRFPDLVQSIQTTSRAELLRKTAEVIVQSVKQGEVQPKDIAIIAPGLDEIARYTFIEILSTAGIPIEPLNEQRPLISSPLIRALLTLLALIYPGLGRLIPRDSVAEMLVILSRKPKEGETGKESKLIPEIDPVRAGLIADYCYHIDLEQPRLLPVETFSRWDRLGYRAAIAYKEIVEWLKAAKSLQQAQHFLNPIFFLDKAIKDFLENGRYLSYEQLSALRELMETARHFWEVKRRLQQHQPILPSQIATIAEFIQLLRRGTITANPRPLRYLKNNQGAVTLANIFQYRSLRRSHRWHFWLDAASHLWDKGGAAILFAAPLFLQEWSGRTWLPENELEADQQRLERILKDLLGRVEEKLYLCHSDLGVNGTEQLGPLLTLVHASREVFFWHDDRPDENNP